MRFYRRTAAAFLVIAALAACQTQPVEPQRFPAELSGIGDTSAFPLAVGPYMRGRFFAYDPTMRNISVGYDRADAAFQNVTTLYFYPRSEPVDQHFESVKREVVSAHPDAVPIGVQDATLEKDGVAYRALVASFRFTEFFAGSRQLLYSELILVQLGDRWFKVRSSSPIAQAPQLHGSVVELLKGVAWTN